MKKVIDIELLTKEKNDELARINLIPFSERDYTEYYRLFMKLKYHSNKAERERILEKNKERYNSEYFADYYRTHVKPFKSVKTV